MVNARLWLRPTPAEYAFRPIRRQTRPDGVVPRKLAWNQWDAVYSRMTDEQIAEMHKVLVRFHRGIARDAALDVVQQYHADFARRLADEAALIPRRTAIVQRLHEREQRQKDEGE